VKKENKPRKLQVRRDTLRVLSMRDLVGAIGAIGGAMVVTYSYCAGVGIPYQIHYR
jgi:CheY-specific phosphatase CheX